MSHCVKPSTPEARQLREPMRKNAAKGEEEVIILAQRRRP